MSMYTTEVRYICESYASCDVSKDYMSIDEILDKACEKIFDFPFPIFDENYRKTLECKILRHYYTREICAESVGLWKLYLNRRMNEIMPYYNQLYKSELIQFNPLYDVDLRTESSNDNSTEKTNSESSDITSTSNNTSAINGETSNTSTSTQKGSGSNTNSTTNIGTKWDEYSDTPQGTVGSLNDDTYLTNARKNTDNTTNTSTGSSTNSNEIKDTANSTSAQSNTSSSDGTRKYKNNSTGKNTSTQKYLETVQGKRGGTSNSKMLMEFRETFLNIDMQIINGLEDLFMLIW